MPAEERVQAQSDQCWDFVYVRDEYHIWCLGKPDHRGLHWASGTDRHKRVWRLTWR